MSRFLKNISIVLSSMAIMAAFYPRICNYYSQRKMDVVISQYSVNSDDKTLESVWKKAVKYNETSHAAVYNDIFKRSEDSGDYPKEYMDNLNINGIMGYIIIPSIGVQLPIYHGTSPDVLQKGIGHLQQSSLPVGGKDTHCVLAGHTGMNSAKMFNDLVKMKVGDSFCLTVAGHELVYEVDNIETILPKEIELLQKVPDKDYCTLVTCTPYGVNTHRLLVRGVRVDKENIKETTQKLEKAKDYTLVYLAASLILSVMVLNILWRICEEKKN